MTRQAASPEHEAEETPLGDTVIQVFMRSGRSADDGLDGATPAGAARAAILALAVSAVVGDCVDPSTHTHTHTHTHKERERERQRERER